MSTVEQNFKFSSENMIVVEQYIKKYPDSRQASAVLPLLDLAQRQNGGWLSNAAMSHVAELLEMAEIRVFEVATFYTMFNLEPVGKNLIQLCRTTPCWLRGANVIKEVCEDTLGIKIGETTDDAMFSLVEVECLGACVNAPMMQINDDFYEDLSEESTKNILLALQRGEKPSNGPQIARQTSAPVSGSKTLIDSENA